MAGKVTDTDKGFQALFRNLDKAAKPRTLTVGVHEEDGGAQAQGGKLTVGEVATINEYGLGVPERSFIRAWVDANEAQIKDTLRKIGAAVLKGKGTPDQGLDQAGLLFVGQIQGRIASGIPPENAPSTVARKGSSTPLIDSGQLRSSIRHKVGEE